MRHALLAGAAHDHAVLTLPLAVRSHVLAQYACAAAVRTVYELKLTRRAQVFLQAVLEFTLPQLRV